MQIESQHFENWIFEFRICLLFRPTAQMIRTLVEILIFGFAFHEPLASAETDVVTQLLAQSWICFTTLYVAGVASVHRDMIFLRPSCEG